MSLKLGWTENFWGMKEGKESERDKREKTAGAKIKKDNPFIT